VFCLEFCLKGDGVVGLRPIEFVDGTPSDVFVTKRPRTLLSNSLFRDRKGRRSVAGGSGDMTDRRAGVSG